MLDSTILNNFLGLLSFVGAVKSYAQISLQTLAE